MIEGFSLLSISLLLATLYLVISSAMASAVFTRLDGPAERYRLSNEVLELEAFIWHEALSRPRTQHVVQDATKACRDLRTAIERGTVSVAEASYQAQVIELKFVPLAQGDTRPRRIPPRPTPGDAHDHWVALADVPRR